MTALEVTGWASDTHALADFLAEPNLCRVGTIDGNGDPHVVPAWFHWRDERFYVGAQEGDHKVANIRRSGRAAIEIDSDIRRKRGVLVRGSAWLIDGDEGRSEYLSISLAQVRRYQPDKPPIETANRMVGRGTPLVIVIDPERVVSWGR